MDWLLAASTFLRDALGWAAPLAIVIVLLTLRGTLRSGVFHVSAAFAQAIRDRLKGAHGAAGNMKVNCEFYEQSLARLCPKEGNEC
jgi:hypothetical protein